MHSRRSTLLLFLALIVLGLGLCVPVPLPLVHSLSNVGGEYDRPEGTYFMYSGLTGNIEQHVLYADFFGVSRHFRDADMVIMGNSRTQCALDVRMLEEALRPTVRSVYMLACGNAESSPFALALLERYDLKPRYLLLNIDDFFRDVLSPPARDAVESPPLDSYRTIFQRSTEFRLYSLFTAATRMAGPRLPALGDVIFRSFATGDWDMRRYANSGRDIHPVAEKNGGFAYDPDQVDRFLRYTRARNIEVICFLPPATLRYNWPEALAFCKRYGLPLLAEPVGPELFTFDTAHLSTESEIAYTGHVVSAIAPMLR